MKLIQYGDQLQKDSEKKQLEINETLRNNENLFETLKNKEADLSDLSRSLEGALDEVR